MAFLRLTNCWCYRKLSCRADCRERGITEAQDTRRVCRLGRRTLGRRIYQEPKKCGPVETGPRIRPARRMTASNKQMNIYPTACRRVSCSCRSVGEMPRGNRQMFIGCCFYFIEINVYLSDVGISHQRVIQYDHRVIYLCLQLFSTSNRQGIF